MQTKLHPAKHLFLSEALSAASNTVTKFIARNTVLAVAFSAALLTSLIVKPDALYAGYFDFKTLSCLFSVLAVVGALRNISFFTILASETVKIFKTARLTVLALVYITFIGSMLIANDMALLTFLPLGYFTLSSTGKEKYMAFTFIMQNIAANLGGMLTPFGNPQNLYLYTKFNIGNGEFVAIMAPLFCVSVAIITVCCLFVKNERLEIGEREFPRLKPLRTGTYLLLFALSIVAVFRIIPYYIVLAVIIITLLFLDGKALKNVDYPLLLTFVCFFVFAGNMARIDIINGFFSALLEKSTLLVSIASCQCISNVPTAVLLSQFTDNYRELLMGVNIGGVGTLISSLASLITFRQYQKACPGKTKRYLLLFSALNFGFLIILTVFAYLLIK